MNNFSGFRLFWNWITWQRVPIQRLKLPDCKFELKIFLLYAFAYIIFSYFTALLIQRFPLPILGAWKFNHQVWYAVFFKIIGLLIIPSLVLKHLGHNIRDTIMLDWELTPKSGTWLIVSFAIGLFINGWHLSVIPFGSFASSDLIIRAFAATFLPLLSAALPEEVFYRRVLQSHLELAYGRSIALFSTAFLFTAWHLPSRWLLASGLEGEAGNFSSVLLSTGLPVFIFALLFGVLWDRYRSLLPLISFHWALDIPPGFSSFFGIKF